MLSFSIRLANHSAVAVLKKRSMLRPEEWYFFVRTFPLHSSILCNYFMHLTEVLLVSTLCYSPLISSQIQEEEKRRGKIKTRSRPWKWPRSSFFRSVTRAGAQGCWRAAWYQAWWLGPVSTRRKRRCWIGWCFTNQGTGKCNLLLPLEGMIAPTPKGF